MGLSLSVAVENPKLCENIVVRKAWFGGLVFRKSDMSVFQVNDATYHVLELIKNANSFNNIYEEIKKDYNLARNNLQELLEVLYANKVIK